MKVLSIGIDPSLTNSSTNEDHNGIVITDKLYSKFDSTNFQKKTINSPITTNVYVKLDFVIASVITLIKEFVVRQGSTLQDYDYVFLFIEEFKQQYRLNSYRTGKDADPMGLLIYVLKKEIGSLLPFCNIKEIQRSQAKFVTDKDLVKKGLLEHYERAPLHERDACRVLVVGHNKIKRTTFDGLMNTKGELDYE